eukprot:GHVS01013463.1.p2 GENE.GHVS01013463.1~~GHVS01013463.1.p2  ORF type:complete len:225 (+),score=42.13 GHVS01013463.1:955-1629(+)
MDEKTEKQKEKDSSDECVWFCEKCLLGEFQLSYICFILGHNYDSFVQWKSLMGIFCNTRDSTVMRDRPRFYANFIRLLYTQIEQAPSDLLSDELLKNNFIAHCIRSLAEVCYPPLVPAQQGDGQGNQEMVVGMEAGHEDDNITQLNRQHDDKLQQLMSKDTTSSTSSANSAVVVASDCCSSCSLVVVKRMRYLEELLKSKFGLENVSDIQWLTDEDAPVVVDDV